MKMMFLMMVQQEAHPNAETDRREYQKNLIQKEGPVEPEKPLLILFLNLKLFLSRETRRWKSEYPMMIGLLLERDFHLS